jgi:hypothetical protein
MSESDLDSVDGELDMGNAVENHEATQQKEPARMSLIEEKRERERLSRLMAFGEEL